MIKVGINGFGRIGKCLLLQLLENPKYSVTCLNAPSILVSEIQDYLAYDTTHKHGIKINVKIIDDKTFEINNHTIKLFKERDAKKIGWDCDYLFDATGAYLTAEKCCDHNVPYIIMSSPPKDKTPTFIYSVNDDKYNGERVVSGSSCTTNCIAPMLRILDDAFTVQSCVFTTIHATTASQYVVDVQKKSSRSNRSIINNIIPHTTGASSSIISVLPDLKGKINGTSVRVPVVNCSLIDMNIELEKQDTTLDDIQELLKTSKYFNTVYNVTNKNLVSSDFTTTDTPTILDINACISLGNGKFKLFVWYDNEWSYSAQLIRLVDSMHRFNNSIKEKKYYFENLDFREKGVVCRLDFNVPRNKAGEVTDDFRVYSAIPTINTILERSPKYLILTSHFGRPKGPNSDLSLRFLVPILQKYLLKEVRFLEHGLHEKTLKELEEKEEKEEKEEEGVIYLLENLRFHEEETAYEKDAEICANVTNIYKALGDVFVCDAFGCAHRKHLSIYAMKYFGKPYGYGHLIKKEMEAISSLINSPGKKVLGIIGGNKIQDKMPIIDSLRKIPDSKIYIAGGLAKQYKKPNSENEIVMSDGYGSSSLDFSPEYIDSVAESSLNVYDIGRDSLEWLKYYIKSSDIIFWNGSLGVIEHEEYKKGSLDLLDFLFHQKEKTVIIGGGETASLITDKTCLLNVYVSTGGGALLEYLQNKILYNKTLVGLEIYL
jgi:glyceraldehyde 3-phosphate dehydrogenase